MKPIDIKELVLEDCKEQCRPGKFWFYQANTLESEVANAVYWPVRNCLLDGVMR